MLQGLLSEDAGEKDGIGRVRERLDARDGKVRVAQTLQQLKLPFRPTAVCSKVLKFGKILSRKIRKIRVHEPCSTTGSM
jgi:hypothetical protein